MANEYNKLTAKIYDPVLDPFIKDLRKRVVIEAKRLGAKKIIDLCCGTGHQLKFFNTKDFEQVIGIDLSPHMVEIAEKYKVNCTVGDATQTPFEDNSFDLAMVSFALHEKPWDLAKSIVDEAYRIVRPQGHFLVVDYIRNNKTHWWGRTMTWTIERLVGGEHYRNFLRFIEKGGVYKMVDNFSFVKEIPLFKNSVGIMIFQKDR